MVIIRKSVSILLSVVVNINLVGFENVNSFRKKPSSSSSKKVNSKNNDKDLEKKSTDYKSILKKVAVAGCFVIGIPVFLKLLSGAIVFPSVYITPKTASEIKLDCLEYLSRIKEKYPNSPELKLDLSVGDIISEEVQIENLKGHIWSIKKDKCIDDKYGKQITIILPANRAYARQYIPLFLREMLHGMRFVAIDFSGFGDSDLFLSSVRLDEPTIYEDVIKIYELVKEKVDHPNLINLIAHSIGSAAAAKIAAEASLKNEFIRSMTLFTPISSLRKLGGPVFGNMGNFFANSDMDITPSLETLSKHHGRIHLRLISGDKDNDFLSLEKSGVNDIGSFNNKETLIVSKCKHSDIVKMYETNNEMHGLLFN